MKNSFTLANRKDWREIQVSRATAPEVYLFYTYSLLTVLTARREKRDCHYVKIFAGMSIVKTKLFFVLLVQVFVPSSFVC